MTTIGIIGGSGLYALDGLGDIEEVEVDTPFGRPSDRLVTGDLGGNRLVFLPRHGRGHVLSPSEVPYRANIYALKSLGVEWLISVSAVGSMKEQIAPGDFVLADQYIDRTYGRVPTFFGNGLVVHISLAEPTCPTLRARIADVIEAAGVRCHRGGTYICIEGPAFSTRGESLTFRAWGVDVIGMTAMPEVRLAREAEIHYATIALATDYDCWHETDEAVSADAVIATLKQNTANVIKVLAAAIPAVGAIEASGCACNTALASAVLTQPDAIPSQRLVELGPLVQKYF